MTDLDDRTSKFPDGDPVTPLYHRRGRSLTWIFQAAITIAVWFLAGMPGCNAKGSDEPCRELQHEVDRLKAELVGVRAMCGARCRVGKPKIVPVTDGGQ
jgi:hypothetical protein